MRISDWSSDVCSSDLLEARDIAVGGPGAGELFGAGFAVTADDGAETARVAIELLIDRNDIQPFLRQYFAEGAERHRRAPAIGRANMGDAPLRCVAFGKRYRGEHEQRRRGSEDRELDRKSTRLNSSH